MATTTNYGWTTPDNTALVKDGASAIRTLGSSVDTTVKALSPGTTAGDVDYYTSSTAKARLAIGSSGQVLAVSGGVPSWQTIATSSMTLLSTTNLSGTSTTVSSISGAYTDLVVLIQDPYFNASAVMLINPNSTANVGYSMVATGGGTAQIAIIGSQYASPTTSQNGNYAFLIKNYADATYMKPFQFYGTATPATAQSVWSTGMIGIAGAITSLQFTSNAGTSTYSGGRVLIYGVK